MSNIETLDTNVFNVLVGSTTLSTTLGTSDLQVTVASATGIVVPSLATGQSGSFLFLNGEMLQVTGAGTGTTTFRVKRGVNGTKAESHLAGCLVWVGNAATSTGDPSRPTSNNLFTMFDCQPAPITTPVPIFGGPASSSAASVAGTIYWSQITVPFHRPVTGISILNGATAGGTDNHILALYSYDGKLIGQTAATASSGTSQLQNIPLVTPVQISGNRSYYIAYQSNGTTDLVQKYVTGQVGSSFNAGSQTGVSGTIPATLTSIAATFTTAKGPIGGLY
jgi:hypothetical protein